MAARQTSSTTKAGAGEPAAKLTRIASRAGKTGRAVGEASVKLATPVARSLKQQDSQTLAKMLLAAALPKLAEGAVRFVIRNPKIALVGVALAAVVLSYGQDHYEADA